MTVIDLSPPGHPPRSLLVFLRARKDRRSSQYYARRLVPLQFRKTPRNPYLTKALGAVSLERAKELAWQWWTSTEQKINRQESLDDASFSTVAESYLRDLKIKTTRLDNRGRPAVNPKKYTRHEQSIRLHLNPFFGPMSVSGIKLDDSERWLEWRRLPNPPDRSNEEASELCPASARSRVPARSTIQKDAVAFSGVIRHARLHLKVDTRFVPGLLLPPETADTRRPRFYPDEWRRIADALNQRSNTTTGKRGVLSYNSWWFRIMLFYFVTTLHGSGLRVAEAMRLKVRHLRRVAEHAAVQEAYQKNLQLAVGREAKNISEPDRAKIIKDALLQLYQYRVLVRSENQLKHYTHGRDVIPLIEMTTYFDQLLSILKINLPDTIIREAKRRDELPPDVWLFCHPDGRRIKSFDNGFDEVLSELGLLYHDGRKRSLTSLRHTYASERIEAQKADLKSIADNMGTTLDMLYKHYSQEIRELRAADLQVIRDN
jgi:integrase